MKKLIIALLLSLSLTACADEATQPQPVNQPVAIEQPEQKIETKKVCIMVYDAKINKEVQKCRTMKIHQKHEGTIVPEKK